MTPTEHPLVTEFKHTVWRLEFMDTLKPYSVCPQCNTEVPETPCKHAIVAEGLYVTHENHIILSEEIDEQYQQWLQETGKIS